MNFCYIVFVSYFIEVLVNYLFKVFILISEVNSGKICIYKIEIKYVFVNICLIVIMDKEYVF